MTGTIPTPERATDRAPESKEVTHQRFYTAFHDWFMQSGCDFWSECDAPESLATIAVELSDAFAQAAVEREREACAAIADEAAVVIGCQLTDRITRASQAGSIGAAIRRRGDQP